MTVLFYADIYGKTLQTLDNKGKNDITAPWAICCEKDMHTICTAIMTLK